MVFQFVKFKNIWDRYSNNFKPEFKDKKLDFDPCTKLVKSLV